MANEKRLIDANELIRIVRSQADKDPVSYPIVSATLNAVANLADGLTIVDAVEVDAIKSWLYQIAMNNVGVPVRDFSTACEEIISRLDGLRTFATERREGE